MFSRKNSGFLNFSLCYEKFNITNIFQIMTFTKTSVQKFKLQVQLLMQKQRSHSGFPGRRECYFFLLSCNKKSTHFFVGEFVFFNWRIGQSNYGVCVSPLNLYLSYWLWSYQVKHLLSCFSNKNCTIAWNWIADRSQNDLPIDKQLALHNPFYSLAVSIAGVIYVKSAQRKKSCKATYLEAA